MEEKKTLFYDINSLLATYGLIVILFVILQTFVGEGASVFSSLFAYGANGFTKSTLLQLFALSVIITAARILLLSDRLIRRMSMLLRNALFFVTITLSIILFVICFNWFPVTNTAAWIGFFISFGICSAVGIIFSRLRERSEDQKMNRALEEYAASEEEEE